MISAIITAAGKNRRMRADLRARGIEITHKLLLNVHGVPLILRTIQNTLNAGVDECIVVLGHYSDEITSVIDELDDERVRVTINPQINVELSKSLLNGVKEAKSPYCLCVAADQPTVSAKTLKRIIEKLYGSRKKDNTISILARDQTGYLNSAEGLGMPFACHRNLLERYLNEFNDNLNPILRKMINDGISFYGVEASNDLELININTFNDYLKVTNTDLK